MAKKAAKKTIRKTSRKSAKKPSRKSSTTRSVATKAVAPVVVQTGCSWCRNELEDEHLVLSHLMWILFLAATGFAAIFTIFALLQSTEEFYGVKALILLGWAFIFKTFGHRIHVPHH